jgi:hypothetical protein
MVTSNLAKKTLIAGIIIGVVGLLGTPLTSLLIEGINDNAGLPNTGFYMLLAIFSAILSFCLPLGAALIAASLVMRHAESLTDRHRHIEDAHNHH